MVLMTDMQTIIQPGNMAALLSRVAMFNALRDNQGTFVLNKNTEDFKNVQASLAGLHELQAQALEFVCIPTRLPLVKFTGISPSGLNATSEFEVEVYDDTISAYQNRFFRPNLEKIINFEQLSLFGEVDPEISWRFNHLRDLTDAERAEKESKDAERDSKYVDMGALAPGDVRKRIIDDPDMPYTALDPDDVPDLLGEIEQGLEPEGGRPDPIAGGGKPGNEERGGEDADLHFAHDAGWNEADHPRGQPSNAGQFGAGGGGGASKGAKAAPAPAPAAKAYSAGLKAHGLAWATAQKIEWRQSALDSLEALVKASPANQALLVTISEKAAKEVGTTFKNPGVKKQARIEEKLARGKAPNEVNDAVRGGFDVDTPEEGDRIIEMLSEHFEVADEGWTKTDDGYFDRKTIVRFPDGQLGEVQMWPPGMFDAKENGGGHQLYKRAQKLPKDSSERAELVDQMRALYGGVEKKLPPEWGSLFRKGGSGG
jgi:hypothetical protein